MTRKLLALFLIFCFAFTLTTAFGAEDSSPKNYDISSAVKLLDAVGVIDSDEFNGAKYVTRGEFAAVVHAMLGLEAPEEAYNGDVSFSDVDGNHKYAHQIYGLKSMNLISGFSDGTFRPDTNITATEFIVVITRALGYGYRAEAKGGYPGGYYSVFATLEMNDYFYIGYSDYVKWNDAVVLIRAALEEDLDVQTYGEDGITTSQIEEGTNLLNTYLDVDMIEGVVTGVDITNLRGDNTTPPRRIVVGTTEIYVAKDDVYGYLGYCVKAYYKSADRAMGRRLLYIEKDEDNTEYVIDTKDVVSVADGIVEAYGKNNKKTKYKYEKYAAIIYNGVSTKDAFDKDLIAGESGVLKLVDNTGDRVADVVVADIYENYVVGKQNTDNYRIYDYYDSTKSIALDLEKDEPYVLLYNKAGAEIPFSSISKMAVVSVSSSRTDAPQDFVRAYVSTEKVCGTLEAKTETSSGYALIVGGKEVELTAKCMEYAENEIKIGAEVEVGLDIHGYGAYVKLASSDKEQFGYLMAMQTESGLEGETYVKFMDDAGYFGVTKFAKNVTIDNKTYREDYEAVEKVLNKSAKTIFGNEIPEGCIAQAMRYSVNANGEINFIDTVLNSHDGTLGTPENTNGANTLYMIKYDKLNYKQNAMSLGGQVLVSNSTKVFMVPMPDDTETDYMDEDYYNISSRSYFQDNNYYTGVAYYSDNNAASAQLITVKSSAAGGAWGSTEEPFAIFEKAAKAFDEKEEVVTRVYYWQYGKLQTMILKDDNISFTFGGETFRVDDLKCGDMFRYSVDGRGQMDAFVLVYRAQTDTLYPVYTTGVYDAPRVVTGYVYGVYDDGFKFMVTDDVTDLEGATNLETARNIGTVMIYDKDEVNEENRLKSGIHSDMQGYDSTYIECSRIVLQQRYCAPVGIYIIK